MNKLLWAAAGLVAGAAISYAAFGRQESAPEPCAPSAKPSGGIELAGIIRSELERFAKAIPRLAHSDALHPMAASAAVAEIEEVLWPTSPDDRSQDLEKQWGADELQMISVILSENGFGPYAGLPSGSRSLHGTTAAEQAA